MLLSSIQYSLVIILIITQILGNPLRHDEPHPLPLSKLNSRIESRVTRPDEVRLPLPTPQELEALRKVAQILAMLGQQVIPAIVGEPTVGCVTPAEDTPNDFVADK